MLANPCHNADGVYTNSESRLWPERFRYGHAGDISISEVSTNRDRRRFGYCQFLLALKPDVTCRVAQAPHQSV